MGVYKMPLGPTSGIAVIGGGGSGSTITYTQTAYTADELANYTTDSNNWTNVDGTNFSLELNTNGGQVLATFTGMVYALTYVYFDIAVNGSRVGTSDGIVGTYPNSNIHDIGFTYWINGLPAQVNTFTLQWKISSGGSAILYAGAGSTNTDVKCQFGVAEFNSA